MKKHTGSGRIAAFLKKEAVLCIAAVLAFGSMFLVPPDAGYLNYPDYRVLALLFCLMLVIAGLQEIGLFRYLGLRFLGKIRNTGELCLLLTALCFFGSMLITNDVALITFVPFAVMVLTMAGQQKLLIPVVVLQTIAANLGSMLTPIGNPQNLYLYTAFALSMGTFLGYMLPLAAVSLVLQAGAALLTGREPLSVKYLHPEAPDRRKLAVYLVLFLVCLICVLRLLPWPLMLGIVAIGVFITGRSLFGKVDYFLLLTFVCFFLFIGNAGRIPAVSSLLKELIQGRELPAGVVLSQVISNVPAAILLSGFTDHARGLLYGVNIGGLGTLIASLASVISYRLYGNSEGAEKGTYMKTFTLYNVVFLAVLYAAAVILLHLAV